MIYSGALSKIHDFAECKLNQDVKYNVRLSDCTEGDILEYLEEHSTESLIIPHNRLTSPKLDSILCILSSKISLTNIREIDLSFNDIGSSGVRTLSIFALKCPYLYSLDLSGNPLKNQGLQILSEEFLLKCEKSNSLITLKLADIQCCVKGLINLLTSLTNSFVLLKCLDISKLYIFDADNSHIYHIKTFLRSDSARNLTFFIMRNCNLCDSGVKIIVDSILHSSKNAKARPFSVDFTANKLGPDSLLALSTLLMTQNLKMVSMALSNNPLGCQQSAYGIKVLMFAATKCQTLRSLDLRRCSLSGHSLCIIAKLINKTKLTSLFLRDNSWTEDACYTFAHECPFLDVTKPESVSFSTDFKVSVIENNVNVCYTVSY